VEGHDYVIKEENAEGDMTTLNTLVDAALTEQADMVYTITTPALQAAMHKVHDRPLLFALALDPVQLGDPGTDQEHLANEAGVYDRSPFEGMMKVVHKCLPNARSIGTLYAPGEANSVNFRDELDKAAHAAGMKLVALPSNSPADVADAALALTERSIDAIVQISDNLHGEAFPSIVSAARRAKLPIFAFSSGEAAQGAAVVLANDHFDGGRESGLIAARVIRGQSPATFPYHGITKTRLLINRAAAAEAGMQIPDSVAQQAEPAAK